jgi:hypothetical protein
MADLGFVCLRFDRVCGARALDTSASLHADPSVSVDPEYLMALIAVLGTTISPSLFFWQTSQEVEDVRINKHESPLRKSLLRRSHNSGALRSARASAWRFRTASRFSLFLRPRPLACFKRRPPHSDGRRCGKGFATFGATVCCAVVRSGNYWDGNAGDSGAGRFAYAVSELFGGGRVWRASHGARLSFTTFFLPLRYLGCA